jgi:hypothetical protein
MVQSDEERIGEQKHLTVSILFWNEPKEKRKTVPDVPTRPLYILYSM